MNLQILDYEVLSAEENMQKDINILNSINNDIFLRLYSWQDACVTYGYNQSEDLVKKIVNEKMGLSIKEFVKRPTGGGLVVHKPSDLSWTICLPVLILQKQSLLSFYYNLSKLYSDAFLSCGIKVELVKHSKNNYSEKRINDICEEFPAKYELVDESNKKVIGSAQKKTKTSLIQQNNLFIPEPLDFRDKLVQSLFKYFS